MIKKRLFYAAIAIVILFFALFLRKMWSSLPYFLNFWVGDFLWAVMLYYLCRAFFLRQNILKLLATLILFCWIIETSQAWHTPWLDAFRNTTFGGLLLGHGFLWSDILAYTAGGIVAYWFDQKYK